MQANWENIQGKAPTTAADLDTALRMSARLMRIVGAREQGPAQLATATDQRLRAFTLALRTYDDIRRAVGYLRAREGDADSIAPALYQGRPRRKQVTPPAATSAAPAAPAAGADAAAAEKTAETQVARVASSASAQHAGEEEKSPFLS